MAPDVAASVRVIVRGQLGTARLTVQVDVGFGDAVHPAAENLVFPTALEMPAPKLRGYPRELVLGMNSLELATTVVRERKAYHDAIVRGCGVLELDPTRAAKAAVEIDGLMGERVLFIYISKLSYITN